MGAFGWFWDASGGPSPVIDPVGALIGPSPPGGRVWPVLAQPGQVLAHRLPVHPQQAAISRLECSVVWSVRIVSISAIVSRFAILDLLQQRVAEG